MLKDIFSTLIINFVCLLDLGPEAEGSQGGPRAEEEEVRLPEGVQALRQQQVDHPREQRRVDTHSFDLRRGYTRPTSCRVPC